MEITELIELNDKALEVLGWNGGGSINIGYNVEEVGDLVLYVEIHNNAIVTAGDLREAFNDLEAKLNTLFGNKAERFEFFDDENSQSGYSVAIPMTSFSINSKELRMEKQ